MSKNNLSFSNSFALLFLFFLALPSISFAQNSVDVVRNPTTSYFESSPRTYNLPSGFSSGSRAVVPVASPISGGGLSQDLPSDLIIDANKQRSSFTPSLKAGGNAVKSAAVKCIKSFRCNAATLAGSVGLELLFSQMDWSSLPDGSLVTNGPLTYPADPPFPTTGTAIPNCLWLGQGQSPDFYYVGSAGSNGCESNYQRACPLYTRGRNLQAATPSLCSYTDVPNYQPDPVTVPVSPSSVDDAVNDHYQPHPSDWPNLTSDIDLSEPDVIIEVPSIPSIETPPKTTTNKDSSGSPVSIVVEETRYDISVRSGTNGSKKPVIDVEETTTTTTYDPDSSTVSSSTTSSSLLGGDPVSSSVTSDIPTDCAFMPTVCAFIDWFKDLSTEPEPDLSVLLTDQDYEQTYTIDFGAETCPEPIDINISFIDQTVQLSYQPACDFVGYARPFVLISAYLFAIYIGLGVVRNG